jgi:hypothetical protein
MDVMAEETTLTLPPRHPRVPQLIQLERSRMQRVLELKAIEQACEKAAEPFALEIERLERDLAAVANAVGAADRMLAELDEAERRHFERMERIRQDRVAEDAGLAADKARIEERRHAALSIDGEMRVEAKRLEKGLEVQRALFDRERTTSAGRSIERKIQQIVKQQRTIVARNPGARFFRLELGISAEAARTGLLAKVAAVACAIKSEQFGALMGGGTRDLRHALQAEPSDFELKLLALRTLSEMNVPTDDTEIRVV